MQNPILENQRTTLTYFFVWLLVVVVHILLLAITGTTPVEIALYEGFISNILFAALGLSLWYPIFYGKPENEKPPHFIVRHLFACLTSVALWIGVQYLIYYSVFSSQPAYHEYFRASIAWKAVIGILYYWLIILVYYLLVYYRNMREGLVKEERLKTLIRESELNSLKSQINPHFLFNSLNSINSLTVSRPEKAQDMIIKLSEFLRYSISSKNEFLTTLQEEIQNVNRYLDIEKIRFGKKLIIVQHIDEDALAMRLPALILQPLIENAVKYGVYDFIEPSAVELTCKSQPGMLAITLINQYEEGATMQQGAGLGLPNIRNRLSVMYGREDLIAIRRENNTFEIQLVIPQQQTK